MIFLRCRPSDSPTCPPLDELAVASFHQLSFLWSGEADVD